jgi:hypothetical protein
LPPRHSGIEGHVRIVLEVRKKRLESLKVSKVSPLIGLKKSTSRGICQQEHQILIIIINYINNYFFNKKYKAK